MGFRRDGLKGSSLQILAEEEIERIHRSSLELLEKTGMLIYDEDILKLLEKAGCKVDFSTKIARAPCELIEDGLKETLSCLRLCGRDEENDMELGDGTLYTRTTGGPPYIIDLNTQKQRKATREDVAQCVRVADALPNIYGVSMVQVVPMDVPARLIDLYAAEVSFNNTEKHLFYVCHNEELIEPVLEMAALVAGGEEELKRRPLLSAFCEVTSPLQLEHRQTKVLTNYAKRKLPFYIHSHPIAGFTSPVTLAGEVALMNAETLMVVLIAQLINSGTPIIYGTSASVPNMRRGSNLAGTVEVGLFGCALAQMARRYHLPCDMTSGIDSKVADAQASMERILTALPPILAGIDLIDLSTTDTKLTFSFEQLVIDNELMGWIARLLRGIKVDEEHLALELIKKVSHKGSFLEEGHTVKHFREELLDSDLISRDSWDDWEREGCKTLRERAQEQVKRILKEHKSAPLSEDVQQSMAEIIKSTKPHISSERY